MSRLLKESHAVEGLGRLRAAVLGAEDGILSLLPCLSRIGLLVGLNGAVALATSKSSVRNSQESVRRDDANRGRSHLGRTLNILLARTGGGLCLRQQSLPSIGSE